MKCTHESLLRTRKVSKHAQNSFYKLSEQLSCLDNRDSSRDQWQDNCENFNWAKKKLPQCRVVLSCYTTDLQQFPANTALLISHSRQPHSAHTLAVKFINVNEGFDLECKMKTVWARKNLISRTKKFLFCDNKIIASRLVDTKAKSQTQSTFHANFMWIDMEFQNWFIFVCWGGTQSLWPIQIEQSLSQNTQKPAQLLDFCVHFEFKFYHNVFMRNEIYWFD